MLPAVCRPFRGSWINQVRKTLTHFCSFKLRFTSAIDAEPQTKKASAMYVLPLLAMSFWVCRALYSTQYL